MARIGALVAGADEPALAALGQYAERLGLAFQIVDDLLDIEGDEQLLGKGVGADACPGKLTYPALYGVDAARRRACDEVDGAKAALAPFGERASFLEQLAEYTLASRPNGLVRPVERCGEPRRRASRKRIGAAAVII